MASKSKAASAREAAEAAWEHPYVRRIVEDAELRANVLTAYENARSAFGRLNNGKPATKQLRENKKLQKEMKQAAEALRDAGVAMAEGPKKKRRGGVGKLLVIAIIGFGVALVASEGLRNKVLDTLFGAEEEFDYTSTTAPPPPAPAAGEPVSSSNS
jgi:hypothetical protein